MSDKLSTNNGGDLIITRDTETTYTLVLTDWEKDKLEGYLNHELQKGYKAGKQIPEPLKGQNERHIWFWRQLVDLCVKFNPASETDYKEMLAAIIGKDKAT
jgi:hypothetical protein